MRTAALLVRRQRPHGERSAKAPSEYVNAIALELDGPLQTDPAAEGGYV